MKYLEEVKDGLQEALEELEEVKNGQEAVEELAEVKNGQEAVEE